MRVEKGAGVQTLEPGQRSLSRDFVASIVVFLVALPLCMGIAIASGVPPAKGLLTGIIGGIITGTLAGSPLQVSGPAAGLAVIVFELVRQHGVEALGPVVLMAGALQTVAGFLRVGRWFRAISPEVIFGMLAGIGVLIFAGQFHVMVDDKPRENGIQNILSIPESILKGILPVDGSAHHIAAAIGIATIVTILLWNKFKPKKLAFLPGALLGVVLATGLAVALQLPIRRVEVPASLWGSLDLMTAAGLGMLMQPALLLAGLTFALVASAETLLSAAAVDQMHTGPRTNYDKELVSQGAGNLACGFVGSLPMTGVIVRSSANVQAGATSRASTILHGFWILLSVLLLPFVLNQIPVACLAAILVFTGYKLVDVAHVKKLASYGRIHVLIYLATVIGVVAFDLLTGVLLGLAISVLHLIYRMTRFQVRVTRGPDKQVDMHLEGSATFLGIPKLGAQLDQITPDHSLRVHLEKLTFIDHACMEMLSNWQSQAEERGGRLEVRWDELLQRFKQSPATVVQEMTVKA